QRYDPGSPTQGRVVAGGELSVSQADLGALPHGRREGMRENEAESAIANSAWRFAGFSSEERGKGALPLPPPPFPKLGRSVAASLHHPWRKGYGNMRTPACSPPANQGTFLLWASQVKSFDAAAVG